jgi:hypothetical protein
MSPSNISKFLQILFRERSESFRLLNSSSGDRGTQGRPAIDFEHAKRGSKYLIYSYERHEGEFEVIAWVGMNC